MTEKIVEILAEILDGMNKKLPLDEVTFNLTSEKNFNKQDITAAFSLLCDRKAENLKSSKYIFETVQNFRILSDKEKDFLGLENYNYILYLTNVGVLNLKDFNFIMDQISIFPGEGISKKELNWLILFTLIDFNRKLLPGSRSLLYSSDTIN